MNFLGRIFQRILIFLIIVGTLWLIFTQVFTRLDNQLPLFAAIVLTYVISAYILLPQVIHVSIMMLRRGRIPRVTHAADGVPADPVNIILEGTVDDLQNAFQRAGWYKADHLTLKTIWRMGKSFVLNSSYPQAPFSKLYLFGRTQDFGFQQPIGKSPRSRNHIRFWAANINPEIDLNNLSYWIKKHPVDLSAPHIWVGACSKDVGFGFANLTYQLSHRIDKEVDKEREIILNALKQSESITEERYIYAGEMVGKKYLSDGKILCAKLISR